MSQSAQRLDDDGYSDLDSDMEDVPHEEELDHDGLIETLVQSPMNDSSQPITSGTITRASYRTLALLCACFLSIGTHYASYILGPLKSRLSRELGTSNTEFSLLLSAFSLNSTWTPLVGGILASRLGTTFTSILATGAILTGQLLILIGDLTKSVQLMVLGCFIFGLGVSPLAVVQETIIIRFFKWHGLGLSLALGLIAGKGASFVAARTSYPLSESFGPHAPFYCATLLAALSFTVNIIYVATSKWLVRGARAELEVPDLQDEANRRAVLSEAQALQEVAKKRKVKLREITKLGDVFWAYVGVNVLCGAIWHPFIQLAPNLLEKRYELTELDASITASYLLAGSFFLYPICGYVVDRLKDKPIVHKLLILSSTLTMFGYIWLVLPPEWTSGPLPAVISFGTGNGFSPLLLVVIVPHIVPQKYVSTALGAHKCLEQAGGVISQTLAGLLLDSSREAKRHDAAPAKNGHAIQQLLNNFLFLNVLQFIGISGLWALDSRRKRAAVRRTMSATAQGSAAEQRRRMSMDTLPSVTSEESGPLLRRVSHSSDPAVHARYIFSPNRPSSSVVTLMYTRRERRRGEVFAALSLGLIVLAWSIFLGTAWLKLRSDH